MGAMIVTDRVAEPFLASGAAFAHGLTFGGHPVAAAVALANLDLSSGRTCSGMFAAASRTSGPRSRRSSTFPIVGDVRGAGYFWGIELVADQATREPFSPEVAHELTERVLGPALRRRRLICRAADRGYPVIQLAPPLIAGPEEFAEIGAVLREVLTEAAAR